MDTPNSKIKKLFFRKLISSYTFSDNISTVFSMMTDSIALKHFLELTDSSITYYLDVSNITKKFEKDSELLISFDSQTPVILKVENIIETDCFCQISWIAKGNVNGKIFFCDFNFHYMEENKTLFAAVYYIPKNIDYHGNLAFANEETKRQKYYQIINEYLINKEYLKCQTHICKIKADFEFALLYVSNIKIMSELFGELVYTSTKTFERGTKIFMLVPSGPSSKEEVSINAKEIRKSDKEVVLGMSVSFKKNKKLSSYVTFDMLSDDGEQILIIIKEKYNTFLTKNELDQMSLGKIKGLKHIAKVLEKRGHK